MSTLASGFISAANSIAIGDVLWDKADITTVSAAKTPISLSAAQKLFPRLTQSSEVRAFGAHVPSAEVLEEFIDKDEDFAEGALENPFVSITALEKLANSDLSKQLVDLAVKRLKRAADLQKHAGNQALGSAILSVIIGKDEIGSIFHGLLSDSFDDIATLLASFEQERDEDDEKHGQLATRHIKRLHARRDAMTALEAVDADRFNMIMSQFLGLDNEPQKALCVDTFIASWLCESDSFEASIAHARLLPEGGVRHSTCAPEFTTRLTSAAREMLKTHETLWDLVAYRTSGNARAAEFYGNGDPLSFSQLQTYRMAGLDANQISGFVFASTCDLEPEEIATLLEGVSMLPLSQFFMGQKERFVSKGMVTALVENLDEDEISELTEFLSEADLTNFPWYPELLVTIPKYFKRELTPEQHVVLNTAAADALGEDAGKWEALITQAPAWEGSFSALLEEVL